MLPLSLEHVAAVASKEPLRFGCDCVHIRGDEKTYVVYATDRIMALEVQGYPGIDLTIDPSFDAAPDTAYRGSVPAKVWKSTFAAARGVLKRVTANMRFVALKFGLGKYYLSYSTNPSLITDLIPIARADVPPLEKIIPKHRKASIRFDPVKLSTLLDAMAKVAPGQFVELELFRDSPVMKLTSATSEQKLTGVLYSATDSLTDRCDSWLTGL